MHGSLLPLSDFCPFFPVKSEASTPSSSSFPLHDVTISPNRCQHPVSSLGSCLVHPPSLRASFFFPTPQNLQTFLNDSTCCSGLFSFRLGPPFSSSGIGSLLRKILLSRFPNPSSYSLLPRLEFCARVRSPPLSGTLFFPECRFYFYSLSSLPPDPPPCWTLPGPLDLFHSSFHFPCWIQVRRR